MTVLCLVFDKIHFPNSYLPKGDYDKEALATEIVRLQGLPQDGSTAKLIGLLRFLEYRSALDGILEYPTPHDDIFDQKDEGTAAIVRSIYDAHFPPREDFEPHFDSASVKGLPNSEEAVAYAGEFYYQARAIEYAAKHGLPLLDDGSGLRLPFKARYKDNAPALATLVALEAAAVSLPDLPAMTLQELVDFRIENKHELQTFRASMLRYAKTLNQVIEEGVSAEDLGRKARFLVESEIRPSLHDLQRDLENPNRPWHKRAADVARISSLIVAGFLTGGLMGTTAASAQSIQNAALSELESRGDKDEAAKRSGLYYLLKAKMIGNG
ncbi:MAG: hypothetical protein JSR99_08215 [Proteobacteria bacterium]|nr:hypothetical protein [Pseudomonadota bacterium]